MVRTLKLSCRAAVLAAACILPASVFAGGYVNHHHHPHAHVFGTPDNQGGLSCHEDTCRPPNHVSYLKDYFPCFYDIVTQNSPKSTANKDLSIKGMLRFSGLANFDVQYTNRYGTPFTPEGSWYGVGVRPLFGVHDQNVLGSINNANLFIDAAINNWVVAHFDLVYANATRKARTYTHERTDWNSVYRSAAALKVNQAYVLFANPAVMPFYIQLGRFNHPFGHYDPYPITSTLPQLLSQIRTGGFVVGAVLDNGLYASVQWSMSEQSMENLNGFESGAANGNNKDRNYGAKIGFKHCFCNDWLVHVNAAYIADLRDSDYLSEGDNFYNVELKHLPFAAWAMDNSFVKMRRAAGLSVHADMDYRGIGVSANFVTALSGLNSDPEAGDSRIKAWDVTGHFAFPVFCCHSNLQVSYQAADDVDVYHAFISVVNGDGPPPNVFGFTPLRLGNVLPRYRVSASYEIQVLPRIKIAAEWVHDQDWDENDHGTGDSSDLFTTRVQAQF